ncbi:hypothetical protein [Ruminococcus sp.]|uniref:hypothetical protein n=1 Tax=Ruminococcus sp. TaxID=41978 RepID=UPI001B06CBBC|nr:hypothetical protein [Ruminococcus sp.]MBO5559720.1 hypothetical protein [Ruminococcus sp.]
MLPESVMSSITRITGASRDEILRMDIYHEVEHVEKRTGRKLIFSTKRDHRRIGRGNPLIARRRHRTMEDVEKGMMKVKW